MNIDLYILAFSAVTVLVTIWMGFRSAKTSKTASDFFVAGRSVSVGWNASAISGEYLSAASFMGIAGMVMSSGYDALWYPVCYACGYLFLLLFIAGPLRRFGAYTIPDFAEGRFDSPLFRKIAVVFVLFIGFFYTMPQMKGAGTTLAYIFPGLPYWAGVVLVGAVITLNVALGGMKGITLVQAFQYWAKMFAISVPIFVLMAVYGHYGKQVEVNDPDKLSRNAGATSPFSNVTLEFRDPATLRNAAPVPSIPAITDLDGWLDHLRQKMAAGQKPQALPTNTVIPFSFTSVGLDVLLPFYGDLIGKQILLAHVSGQPQPTVLFSHNSPGMSVREVSGVLESLFRTNGVDFIPVTDDLWVASSREWTPALTAYIGDFGFSQTKRRALPPKAPADSTWLNPFGPLTTKAAKNAAAVIGRPQAQATGSFVLVASPDAAAQAKAAGLKSGTATVGALFPPGTLVGIDKALARISETFGVTTYRAADARGSITGTASPNAQGYNEAMASAKQLFAASGITLLVRDLQVYAVPAGSADFYAAQLQGASAPSGAMALRSDLSPDQRMTVNLDAPTLAQTLAVYADITGRQLLPRTNSAAERLDTLLAGKLSRWKLISRAPAPDSGVREHGDGSFTAAQVKSMIEAQLRTNGVSLVAVGERAFRVEPSAGNGAATDALTSAAAAQKAWLDKHEKPLALLYTYSLIIAIVCGTAGLPHILVRFYTNPDGVAAKRTTMWVMILIGVFYVFPPVFGVIGRNLMPELYTGLAGIKGTDQVVLKLPVLLNEKYPPLGSILSGITCAGAFAAFMSTFSGLLVSMTGALAHDVYGRILRPKSTPEQRMRMFKIGAVLIGGVAVLLGSFVEPLEINFMVGQAFAIAAASYFPLLFMAVWWRKLTMKGAAIGMLAGGVCALVAAALTNFSNLASDKGPMGKIFASFAPLNDFWAAHPLLRILCEQPAIWAVPLAILLMIVVSKLTAKTIPADSRMKMLVLHAPEQLGLKQEYIQEHQGH